jgi:thiamine biosynthesis lipoprotein
MTSLHDRIREDLGRREFIGFALGAFVVTAIPIARSHRAGVVRRTTPVMGTIAEFAVVHRDPAKAHEAIDAAMEELRWVERTMTRFTQTSDIGRANQYASRDAVTISQATALVTTEALRWARALDGRYDPAVGAVVQLWDVTHRHEPPPDDRVTELAGRQFHRSVEVDVHRGLPSIRFTEENARIDLGSIAKGYGVDRAVAALRRHGIKKGLVVVGGDLYALGTGPDDEAWSVGIQSPTDDREMSGFLKLADKAVATSGTYQKFFRYRGHRYHHIIDPVTARPRETGMQSLTIVADSTMHADVAATALYGLPSSEIAAKLDLQLHGAQVASVL